MADSCLPNFSSSFNVFAISSQVEVYFLNPDEGKFVDCNSNDIDEI